MWRTIVLVVSLTLSFLSMFQVPTPVGAQETQKLHKIQGVVLDKEDIPIADIWVRIYRDAKIVGVGDTNKDGKYSIEFKEGSPITTIRFDDVHTDPMGRFHPTMVLNLSGKTDHQLNKTMPGQVAHAVGEWGQLEILSAYERLYVLDKDLEGEGLSGKELLRRYVRNMDMLKATGNAQERYRQIKALYEGIKVLPE